MFATDADDTLKVFMQVHTQCPWGWGMENYCVVSGWWDKVKTKLLFFLGGIKLDAA